MDLSSHWKGAVAETAIAAAATSLGIVVSRPVTDGCRYDLVFDVRGTLLRVQCKWASLVGGTVTFNCRTSRLTPSGYVRSTYSAAEVDAIAAYCQEHDECWLVPIAEVGSRRMMRLRLTPAKNNQRTGVTIAERYRLGAIAQLGERRDGSAKVGGSSPPGSIV